MLTRYPQRRMERIQRRVEELRLWRYATDAPLGTVNFTASEGDTHDLPIGSGWPVVETPVRMTIEGTVPDGFVGQPVELELWLGGEGFATIDVNGQRTIRGAIDPYHFQYHLLDTATGGERISIEATVVPKGMFGSRFDHPTIDRAHLVVPIREAREMDRDLSIALMAVQQLDRHEHEAVPRLLDIIEASLAELSRGWPTDSDTTVDRFVQASYEPLGSGTRAGGGIQSQLFGQYIFGGRWSKEPSTGELGPLPDAAMDAIARTRRTLSEGLAALKADYPPTGRVAMTGHAHIDLAWLWPVEETRRKIVRTGWSQINLMDQFPDFRHNQSSAQVYAWIEQDDPELLRRIQERVAEGRWDAIGGMWVEPDNQLTGSEAMVRQALYGQREFQRLFGRTSTVAWLPDSFGFSGGLPQVLRGAGMTRFFTHKMTWNEEDLFPYDLWHWQGLDGSTVLAHGYRNADSGGYNGEIIPSDLHNTWTRFTGKHHHDETIFAFGLGDGGGGPNRQMLENYARLQEYPILPRLHMTLVEEFYERIDPAPLPTWTGEMYLQLHRGTLTSQARTKKLNRESEHRLAEAEVVTSMARLFGLGDDPTEQLTATWKVLLLNQFHDILPGSSIREVYAVTEPELRGVVETATGITQGALSALAGGHADAVRVVNPTLAVRPLTVVVPGATSATDSDGELLDSQPVDGGLLVHQPDVRVPGVGWTTIRTGTDGSNATDVGGGVHAHPEGDTVRIENGLLRVIIGADGTIHELMDLEHDRPVYTDRGNQLWAYVDKPRGWDAWDIDENIEAQGEEVVATEAPEIVEAGPLRVAVRITRRWRSSVIVQTYRLLSRSRELEVDTEIDWQERQVLLRARHPLNVHTHEASFETIYGVQRRPTTKNTTWDRSAFEVAGHRYADLSEADYGVALLNDGRYGHSVTGSVLSLSLLRSSMDPDMRADAGHHAFRYAILPHAGTCATGGVANAAIAFNSPLITGPAAAHAGDVPTDWTLLVASGIPVTLGALKRSEDGDDLIVRIHEPNGARGRVNLLFTVPVESVRRVNLLEEADTEALEPTIGPDGEVQHAIRPFEIVTLRLTTGGAR
ncbi:MAG TPA: glycoside hydrolase family 38 C-terminal domain-containing protein [Thermomicrobiales bacterium]|jgi:alpha-mannosidase|nr:glycoside hydrolase family 38 C-terminal domain-containing protein [Thermomicrobiales bacterium]